MTISEFTARTSVLAGQPFGFVGNTGVSSGAYLYFEMIQDGHPVNAACYLAPRGCSGAPTDPNGESIRTVTTQYFQILPAGEVFRARPRWRVGEYAVTLGDDLTEEGP